ERLGERTLGIVGFGNIGRLVARKSRGLFARLIAADPFVKPDVAAQHGAELLSLDEVLRQADYVTLHVLLTAETRHLMNAERLALGGRGAGPQGALSARAGESGIEAIARPERAVVDRRRPWTVAAGRTSRSPDPGTWLAPTSPNGRCDKPGRFRGDAMRIQLG